MMPTNNTLNWWRLFHCMIRHNRMEEELARTKDTWTWMMDNYVILKKIATDERLDILSAIWTCADENNDLPGYDLVLEKVQGMEKNDSTLDMLKEYLAFAPNLKVHAPEDLSDVLKDCCTDWEKERITNMLKITNRIVNSSIEIQKRKLSGPRDGINYLVNELEEGVLIRSSDTLKPIVGQKEL